MCPVGWHLPSKPEFSTLSNAATCTATDDDGNTVTAGVDDATLTTLSLDTGYCLKGDGTTPSGYPIRWATNPENNDAGGNGSGAYGWTALGTGARYPANELTVAGTTYDHSNHHWGPRYEGTNLTGYRGMWWTSTEDSATSADYADIADDSWRFGAQNSNAKTLGMAVRCVQD